MANLYTRHHNDISNIDMFNNSNASYYSLITDATVAENEKPCYASIGLQNAKSQIARPMTNKGQLDLGTLADVESKIQNRHKELNSNDRNNKDYEKVSLTTPSDCSTNDTITNEDSRFTNPIVNFREMNTIEYAYTPYLFVDLQKAVYNNTTFLTPDRNGVSSRFESKKDKYDLKPKEFATAKPDTYYTELYSGLMPKKQATTTAYDYTFKK